VVYWKKDEKLKEVKKKIIPSTSCSQLSWAGISASSNLRTFVLPSLKNFKNWRALVIMAPTGKRNIWGILAPSGALTANQDSVGVTTSIRETDNHSRDSRAPGALKAVDSSSWGLVHVACMLRIVLRVRLRSSATFVLILQRGRRAGFRRYRCNGQRERVTSA
jgi:hypothetical protein